MLKDIHAQIKTDALAWNGENTTLSLGRLSDFFEQLIPRTDIERLAYEEVLPAFVKFAELNAVSRWWCRLFYSQDLQLPDDVLRQLNTCSPVGIGMRFSSIFGIIGVPRENDPYCVFLYNSVSQKGFFVSRLWGSDPVVRRLKMSDLMCDRLLEMQHVFSKTLREWEMKHPAVSIGCEPYHWYGLRFQGSA